ncbi:hypothetical protein BIW12_10155 [Flavobacterium commune]|uniref:Uncharacterized protein n=1 Tax=Flavobacterium commune TaxID=1306519 RepID=A0A1D9P9L5_9FLAO|nr:hypothetical protein BIW12_07390 [Flavobacterium commune]AOZ99773.1 hypothetical protein BIW12_10155 [Flavobacterium commune]
MVIFHFGLVKLRYQIEEEVGSAEEQPASNKFDDYTIIKRIVFSYPFNYRQSDMAYKKPILGLVFII